MPARAPRSAAPSTPPPPSAQVFDLARALARMLAAEQFAADQRTTTPSAEG